MQDSAAYAPSAAWTGATVPTTVDTTGQKFAFIKNQLDAIRAKCGREAIKTFEVPITTRNERVPEERRLSIST